MAQVVFFHDFTALPLELRQAIWDLAVLEEARSHCIPIFSGHGYPGIHIIPGKEMVSVLLQTNFESRARAKVLYDIRLDVWERRLKYDAVQPNFWLQLALPYYNILTAEYVQGARRRTVGLGTVPRLDQVPLWTDFRFRGCVYLSSRYSQYRKSSPYTEFPKWQPEMPIALPAVACFCLSVALPQELVAETRRQCCNIVWPGSYMYSEGNA